MTLKILGFGIAREIFASGSISIEVNEDSTVQVLKDILEKKYPALQKINSYRIALNTEFADFDDVIHAGDEVAILPAVSGG